MALISYELKPRFPPPLPQFRHLQPSPTQTYSRKLSFNVKQHPTFLPRYSYRKFHPVKSVLKVNYPVSIEDEPEKNLRIRQIVDFLKCLLPGGNWWRLSEKDDSGVVAAKPVSVWYALCRMWWLLANDRWVVFAAFSFLILTAVSEISIPHFLSASIFSAQSGQPTVFRKNALLLVVFCIAAGITSGIRGFLFNTANIILVKKMRETLYSSLLHQARLWLYSIDKSIYDVAFYDRTTVGELTSRLGADCQQVSRVIAYDLNLICRNLLQATGSFIYLLILSWPLGLCSIAICTTLSTAMISYGRYQKKAGKLTQEFTASANEVAQETFSLMRTVRVHGTEEQERVRYSVWLKKIVGIGLRRSAAYGLWTFSFNSLSHYMQAISVLVGGVSILSGRLSAEQLTKFLLYSEALIQSTWCIGDNVSTLMQSVGCSEKVFQLMDLLPGDQFVSQGRKLQKLKGNIDFVNVSFAYPTRPEVTVLQEVNLSAHPNEVIAIVGLSGSGKSTIVNLLLRLYEPTSGEILIDGVSLNTLDTNWLRERIGYVGQEPRLFRMDISSNIRYGCSKDVPQEDIEWAAKQAFAHDFITSLPNGYNTMVDDDLLSGGQKQRIAIARAVLRDPSILILDEATSALDAQSEHNIKGVLRAVKNNLQSRRTVIVIAHRLSTIKAADRILVMNNGQIVEVGSHMELLLKEGLYATLTTKQADDTTPADKR